MVVTVKHLPQCLAGTTSLLSQDWWLYFPSKIWPPLGLIQGFPAGSPVKCPPVIQQMQEMQTQSLGQKDPLEEEMATHPEFFLGLSHGQRSLSGYSPWSDKRVRHGLAIQQEVEEGLV